MAGYPGYPGGGAGGYPTGGAGQHRPPYPHQHGGGGYPGQHNYGGHHHHHHHHQHQHHYQYQQQHHHHHHHHQQGQPGGYPGAQPAAGGTAAAAALASFGAVPAGGYQPPQNSSMAGAPADSSVSNASMGGAPPSNTSITGAPADGPAGGSASSSTAPPYGTGSTPEGSAAHQQHQQPSAQAAPPGGYPTGGGGDQAAAGGGAMAAALALGGIQEGDVPVAVPQYEGTGRAAFFPGTNIQFAQNMTTAMHSQTGADASAAATADWPENKQWDMRDYLHERFERAQQAAAAQRGGRMSKGEMEYEIDKLIRKVRNEHVDHPAGFTSSDEELFHYAGMAIVAYYKFLKYITVLMFILFCVALINFAMYADKRKPTFEARGSSSWYADFFISRYDKSLADAWLGTTIVCVIIMFFACPCYYYYIGKFKFDMPLDFLARKRHLEETKQRWRAEAARGPLTAEQMMSDDYEKTRVTYDYDEHLENSMGTDYNMTMAERELAATNDDHAEDKIVRFYEDGTIDVMQQYRTWWDLFWRRFFSFLVFCGGIAVQVYASIGITQLGDNDTSSSASMGIAIIAATLNLTYQLIARGMTEFEKLSTRGGADTSLVIKLVFFKLANVIAVYASKKYPATVCVYEVIGEQFLSLLFIEIVFVTPVTMIGAYIMTSWHQTIAYWTGSINGDQMHLAQFDMAIEYLYTLYKFYLSCMALVTFPLATAMSLVAFLIEHLASRYRLFKICGKPIKTTSMLRGTALLMMMIIFVAVLATPFAGAGWIMSGGSAERTSTKLVCGGFPK